jgi:hypothetical protein
MCGFAPFGRGRLRTPDIAGRGGNANEKIVGTREMGAAVLKALESGE